MSEASFWAAIDSARDSFLPKAPSADAGRLQVILATLSDEQVQDFGTEFIRQSIRLNDWSIWAAGYIANGG